MDVEQEVSYLPNDEDNLDNRQKNKAGVIVSLCTCLICLLVVFTLMLAVLLVHDKEEAQGYDYPMYQVINKDFKEANHKTLCRRISCRPTIRREGVEVTGLAVLRRT